ncbi:energy-coupled thiamine transporter ThiT [Alkalibacterium sp. 20]|uniref:energy-coupled thiamine transporter ThiT n=1 Tax=Alkalibacterium sp. 20 TaxID=1798803 RepID=UPI0009002BDF|nr:energy-coupled thiamine transporter ThiT [Alkalibacterium sp. 20]OJF89750.1 energy-coupled thiamine transporter ThiT [Alkalibacterium sp. 20]
MRNKKLRIYLEGTLFATIAMVLSLIPTGIGSSFSVSLGMIPLTFYAIRRGLMPGLYAGFLWGLLHFVTGSVYMLNIYQVIIEYTLAYAFVGIAGFYSKEILKNISLNNYKMVQFYILIAVFTGALGRYFWHFIAGWIFWGDYALWGLSAFLFSLVMNGLSMIVTALVTMVVMLMLYRNSRIIFLPKKK